MEDAGLAVKESETACEEVGVKNSRLKYETKRGVKTTPLLVILFKKILLHNYFVNSPAIHYY